MMMKTNQKKEETKNIFFVLYFRSNAIVSCFKKEPFFVYFNFSGGGTLFFRMMSRCNDVILKISIVAVT